MKILKILLSALPVFSLYLEQSLVLSWYLFSSLPDVKRNQPSRCERHMLKSLDLYGGTIFIPERRLQHA